MREIEIKVLLNDAIAVKSRLTSLGCNWSAPDEQRDRVFFAQGDDPLKAKPGRLVLRLREQNGRITLNAKKHITGELDCIEHETAVSEGREAASIIEMLGFVETVCVSKTRQQCAHLGFNLCLDRVEMLGEFLEVEALVEEGNGEELQARMIQLLDRIGVPSSERVDVGYDTLLLRQRTEKPPQGRQT